MNTKYDDTLEWLFKNIPSYQNIGVNALRNKLDNIILICNELKNPQDKIKTIHIAGTNGKGSTSHLIASALQQNGYKVGIFSSPHLKDFRERIKINGVEISEEEVINFIEKYKDLFKRIDCSFFEITTALAFFFFEREKVDFAVIETGLGGRLDATNVIRPIISVITNISYDHTNILGNTLEKIAKEKAGIIKEKTNVVIGEKNIETDKIFIEIAKEKEANIYFSEDIEKSKLLESDLKGSFQKKNILLAKATLNILEKNYKLSSGDIEKGFKNVIKNTNFKGRWQILSQNPKIICDIAHNFSGINEICNQLKEEVYENLYILYGTSDDKNIEDIVKILPQKARYFLCQANNQRSMRLDILEKYFSDNDLMFERYDSVEKAYINAKNRLGKDDLLLITGSNFIVAEFL